MRDQIVGTMVQCLACSTVIWAHDSGHWGDVRGLLNAEAAIAKATTGQEEER